MSRKCSVLQVVMIQELLNHRARRSMIIPPNCSKLRSDAKRPFRSGPSQKSVIRCPKPRVVSCLMKATASKSLGVTRKCTDSRQPAVKDEDGGSCGGSGPLLTPKSARMASGLRHRLLRTLIDHFMWRNGQLEEPLLERKSCEILRCAMEFSNRAWDVPQGSMRAPAPFGRKRQSRGCPGRLLKRLLHPESSTLPYFAASCRRDRHRAAFGPRNFGLSTDV